MTPLVKVVQGQMFVGCDVASRYHCLGVAFIPLEGEGKAKASLCVALIPLRDIWANSEEEACCVGTCVFIP